MLVLSRKVNEKIVIGDGVVVTVLDVRGKHVRLGIEAPKETPIWRAELSFFHGDEAPADRRNLVAEPSGHSW